MEETIKPAVLRDENGGTDENVPDVAAPWDGEKEAPAAGEQTDADTAFQALIDGPYRKAFGQRVEKMIKERLRSAKERDKVFCAYCERLGVDADDPSAVAMAFGEHAPTTEEMDALAAAYPGMSPEREKENRPFLRLVSLGVDVRTAYEVTHLSEIMLSAQEQAEKRVMQRVMQNGARPVESGLSHAPAPSASGTVSQMTEREIEAICRRVARGERVVLKGD